MNVIDTGDADAVTTDGKVWTLYLRDFNLLNIANDGDMDTEIQDIRFGIWPAETSLKRCPLISTMNYDGIRPDYFYYNTLVMPRAPYLKAWLVNNKP